MKKFTGVSFLSLLTLTLVSADTLSEGLSKGMNQVLGAIQGLLGPLFSAILGGTGESLFQKVLFLTIILCLVYVITKELPVFKGNNVIIWIVTVSISLLSTRFMSADLLATMLLPYTTLGVALTALIPLIIFYQFAAKTGNKYTEKIAWLFFGVVFLVIWSSRYATIGPVAWIYFGTAIVAFFFFLFNGTIRKLRIKAKHEQLSLERRDDIAAGIRKQLDELESNKKYHTEERYKSLKRKLEKHLRDTLKP